VNETEKKLLDRFDIARAWAHVEHLATQLPDRYTGSAQEPMSADYIAAQLRAVGLKPQIQEVESFLGVPDGAHLTLTAPERIEIPCAPDTGHGQIVEAEFIVIETAEEARALGDGVAGKVIVIPYSYSYPITPEEARKRGAAGMIYGNWGPSDVDILRVTAPQTWTYWGLPDPEDFRIGEQEAIPQAHIGRQSYERLRDLCRKGRVSGSFSANIRSFWGKSHQVLCDVEPGHPEATEDFVMMAAHHDSWNPGASDDGGGVAVLLEAARVLHEGRADLRRRVRFMFVSGHENGAYATSTWYLDNHWHDLSEHAICFSFTDNPGFANAPEFKIEASEELMDFALACARDVVGEGPKITVTRGNKTADRGFYGIGIPSVYTRCAFTQAQADAWGGAFLGYWNHSNHDTLDKIDPENLARNARIRLLETIRLCGAERLPHNFRPLVAGMKARLRGWQDGGRYDVSGTLALVETLERDLAAFHAAEGDAAAVNRKLKQLSRALTWINYTYKGRYGQDIFGVDLKKPLTIMNSIDELVHHPRNSPMDLMLRARIRRDQNKVEDAVRDAIGIINA
jgi:hypothetical protein